MKIIPFSPAPRSGTQGTAARPSPQGGDDFQGYLESAGKGLRARDKVGLENLIANESAPPGDLSQAVGLVATVIAQMGLKAPSELSRVHDLDGLLCF
ncbi:MAG: hypothetical protein LBF40_05490 [Deltaproteobacteria bacterium]|jgi:hypothetical protein|nr:hypothetical protein [Deltaproteobacteria bacterium]